MTLRMQVRDDFAGPGGWDEGLRLTGADVRVVGVEMDDAACDTAEAAGHERLRMDVRAMRGVDHSFRGYIASPPCQTFSMAGSGNGRAALDSLAQAARIMVYEGLTPEDAIAVVHDEKLDERSVLVLEPLFVILCHHPAWIALEQVPQVLPIWEVYAELLRPLGYDVRTEVVSAEQYGVPQTRKRAILVAVDADVMDDHDLTEVPWPTVTHSRFHSRNPGKLDPGVQKWVSMREALGWGMTERPSMTVTSGGAATGGAEPFGNGARQSILRELDAGRWVQRSNYSASGKPGETAAERGLATRPLDQPSFVMTSKLAHWAMGDVVAAHGTIREADEPAPTLTSSMDNGNFRFVSGAGITGEGRPRDVEHPAPTMTGKGTAYGMQDREAWRNPELRKTAVRISVVEAGILQSFPSDYPWSGGKGKQHEQVGNAIPPVLAAAILSKLVNL